MRRLRNIPPHAAPLQFLHHLPTDSLQFLHHLPTDSLQFLHIFPFAADLRLRLQRTSYRLILLPALLLFSILPSCSPGTDPLPSDDITEIPVLDSYIAADRWAELRSNRWSDEEAGIEVFNGSERLLGTVEPQGAGSRYHSRWSFKLELEEGYLLNGLRTANLSAQIFDDSRLRTLLASLVFGKLGFPTFDFHPVFLRINGGDFGLYLQIERFERKWFAKRGVPVHELIKAGFGARFTYDGGLQLSEYFEKEVPDDDNLNNFGDFIRALDTSTPERIFEDVGRHLDIAQYLRYHAAASVLNHVDGFTNNMLFWKSHPGAPYRVIPWDFDKLLYEEYAIGPVGENDIIRKLLRSDSCVAIYKRELRYIVDSVLVPELLFPELDRFTALIATAHALDPDLGLSGVDLSVECERLKVNFIRRRDYIRDNTDSITRLMQYPRID
ncbi:MAG: CotH kinase family protein [Bacteroidetes bacterium]|nr:CotH kinase family protein [Bacteroidota bacterium]